MRAVILSASLALRSTMKKNAAAAKKASAPKTVIPKYPRHSLEKVLRIPKAILDQNAGKECSDEDTATFLGIKYNKGPYALELSSALKFGPAALPYRSWRKRSSGRRMSRKNSLGCVRRS